MILPCMLYQVVAEEYLQTGQYSPEHLLKLEIVINKRCIFCGAAKVREKEKAIYFGKALSLISLSVLLFH